MGVQSRGVSRLRGISTISTLVGDAEFIASRVRRSSMLAAHLKDELLEGSLSVPRLRASRTGALQSDQQPRSGLLPVPLYCGHRDVQGPRDLLRRHPREEL